MIKTTKLTVTASVVQFSQENLTYLLAATSGIVILNPQQARALSKVLIGLGSEPRRRKSEARKFLWMRQLAMFQTARRIPSAKVERLVRSGNQMASSTRLAMKASGFVLL
jgi:hypothetical protein